MRTLTPVLLLLAPAIALAGFDASSFKKESRNSSASPWDAKAALDGNDATAWQIDPEEKNEGSWIELDVPKGKVDAVSVVVGWNQSDDTWTDYARLKSARIEVRDMEEDKVVLEKEVTFEDKKGRQTIDLDNPEVGGEFSGGKVKLVVLEVYAGKDYENLAMAELLVHMEEFDAFTREVSTVSSSEEGHEQDALVDDSTRTYWAPKVSDKEASFSVGGGRYSVSSIGILPGPSAYGRPKTIEVAMGGVSRTYTMENKASMQYFELPALMGYTGSTFGDVTVTIKDVYEGSTTAQPAVADVKFKATALEAF